MLGRWVAMLGRWAAMLGRWAAMLGRWVAMLGKWAMYLVVTEGDLDRRAVEVLHAGIMR